MWSRTIAVLLSATAVAGAASAQGRPVELGIDGGFSWKVDDPTLLTISVPASHFRVGIFATDNVSVEPSVLFQVVKLEGEDAVTAFGGELGLLYHFMADATRAQGYVRPFAGISFADLGEFDSITQVHVGGAIGVKVPVVEHLAVRLEGGFQYGFENDDAAKQPVVFGLIGFSFRTR